MSRVTVRVTRNSFKKKSKGRGTKSACGYNIISNEGHVHFSRDSDIVASITVVCMYYI